jgi:hypothetical protein
MTLELVWPYVKSQSTPSVEGYIVWVREQKDPLYQFKYEQVKTLIISVANLLQLYLY